MRPWTIEDFQLLTDLVANGHIVLVANTDLGIPTIHGIPGARHCGFGLFEARNPMFTIEFDAGGAMSRTPSGKGYSIATVTAGTFNYDADAVLDRLEELMENAPTLDKN